MLVGPPFNPVYLPPLVEVAAGRETAAEAVERAGGLYASLGMKPLVLRKEGAAVQLDSHISAA